MRRRKALGTVVLTLLLVSMALSACGSSAVPEPAVDPTEGLSETEEIVEEDVDADAADAEDVIPYPVMDDAQDPEDFFGLYSYTTAYGVDEIVDFYTEELEALGYVKDSEVASSSMAVLQFTTDTKIMTINISEAGSGRYSVKITESEP